MLIDAQRADHLGAYGSARGLTPSLDALAARSFVFERAIAASAWTRSSVASLFTSRYPGSHRVLGRVDALAPECTTLAEVLARHGWETLAISTNGNAGRLFGFAQGFETFVYPTDHPRRGEMSAESVTELALQSVFQRQERLAQRPLFLYLHYVDPHDPYLPHPELLPGPEPAGRFGGTREELAALDELPPGERTPLDEARIKHLYRGEVRYCDLWIGRLVDGLRRLGLLQRTLLVVTADHGEGLWDHGERSHGFSLYEEQIHVPLIVHCPGMSERDARRIPEPVSNVDIAPTVLAALGLDPPAAFEGGDLGPLTRGGKRPRALEGVYSELALDRAHWDALRMGDAKLIRKWRQATPSAADRLLIYDLARDPGERANLAVGGDAASSPLFPALQRWHAMSRGATGTARRVDPETLPENVREQLRALGYLQ